MASFFLEQSILMSRHYLFDRLQNTQSFDIAVVGGGATGLGIALDAALRGLKVVLLESHDFAKGSSSRATKLAHGGVRYLAQGNLSLVREALHERALLLKNAPHLARPIPFIMPSYSWWETAFYGIGLKIYDLLAGPGRLGQTEFLSKKEVLARLPQTLQRGLRGGVQYWDGLFDDARLAIAIARTAEQHGALLINYCPVTSLIYENKKIVGIKCYDEESTQHFDVKCSCVINATGVWVDWLRELDAQARQTHVKPLVAPSQGVHLVVDQKFLQSDHALLVPSTSDGRVLFAVPWQGKVILGTTDTARDDLPREPMAFDAEITFILNESARYLEHAPTRKDVLSIWAGLRPLVKPDQDLADNTKTFSREHTILISQSGLVTVTGGKWTTYRAIAQDVITRCIEARLIQGNIHTNISESCILVGAQGGVSKFFSMTQPPGEHLYGSEQSVLQNLSGSSHWLTPELSEGMVRFAAKYEYARTVEDVLARRSRMLFLNARQAIAVAPAVAEILSSETGCETKLEDFLELASQYIL
jgi:glycerol-3-phosphate dehydrogenase